MRTEMEIRAKLELVRKRIVENKRFGLWAFILLSLPLCIKEDTLRWVLGEIEDV